jgi:23S rRNA (pseudouridine1915-N3)-methyltransferase
MKITIYAIGHIKSGPEAILINDYVDRFDRIGRNIGLGPIKIIERETKKSGIESEGKILINSIPSNSIMCILDEKGLDLDSFAFANKIEHWRDNLNLDLSLIIGGSGGLSREIKKRAHHSISLGKLVWPHRLVRVMITEQLYRAASIISGSPYHKA